MANKLALGLVIGGAVSSTVGSTFKNVEGRIKRLEGQGAKARVLQNAIGETMRLRDEWKKAHDTGDRSASGLLKRLESNIDSLKRQGVEVGRLRNEYRALGKVAQGAELQAKGHHQLNEGRANLRSGIGMAAAGTAAVAIPTKVSADYQAIIRDIAIKAGIAGKPEEAKMSNTIVQTSKESGMARNDVADVVNQLVGAGMDLAKALDYAPVAAKFVVGQGAGGEDTAKMIQALQQNAKITDPKQMQKALEGIAFQGQAGSFEASDMAKWFPELLANMGKLGITGNDAVAQLGAMLQVQMKTAGGADEAANNLKNWMGKIGSGDVVEAYDKAGIDYQGSMNTGLQKGMSTLESSFALAQKYIEATDPKKAAQMAEATAKISQEADPAKAKAMIDSLEQALRTGDLFADMQVKAALSAYMANKALYEQLKTDSRAATGILDQNLAERRDTSAQKWKEMADSTNDAMRSIGDALRPATDAAAEGLTAVARGVGEVVEKAPALVLGLTALGAGFVAVKNVIAAVKIGRGLLNVARGSMLGKSKEVQKVFVVNPDSDGREVSAPSGGKKAVALSLVATGIKAFVARKQGAEQAPEGPGADAPKKVGFDPVATGLNALDIIREGLTGGGDKGEDGGGPQKVFVVNAGEFGGAGSVGGRGNTGGRRSPRNRSRRRGAPGPAVPPSPPVPVPRPPSNVLGAVARVGTLGKALPGGSILEAGFALAEVFQNAETQEEKAEGYGGVAGNLAGTMAGAAAGAAIGSVVPIIGTAIGGLVGAYLGSMGGEALGSTVGKAVFGQDEVKAPASAELLAAPSPLALPPVVKPLTPAADEPKVDGSKDALLWSKLVSPPRLPVRSCWRRSRCRTLRPNARAWRRWSSR